MSASAQSRHIHIKKLSRCVRNPFSDIARDAYDELDEVSVPSTDQLIVQNLKKLWLVDDDNHGKGKQKGKRVRKRKHQHQHVAAVAPASPQQKRKERRGGGGDSDDDDDDVFISPPKSKGTPRRNNRHGLCVSGPPSYRSSQHRALKMQSYPPKYGHMPANLETPPEIAINEYWVYYPVPTKALFRAVLSVDTLEAPPAEAILMDTAMLKERKDEVDEALAKAEEKQLQFQLDEIDRQKRELHDKMQQADVDHFDATLAKQFAELDKKRMQVVLKHYETIVDRSTKAFWEQQAHNEWADPVIQHRQRENERKAGLLRTISTNQDKIRRTLNKVQTGGVDLMLSYSQDVEAYGNEEDKKQLATAVDMTLPYIEDITRRKDTLSRNRRILRCVDRDLTSHVPTKKHKYDPSGEYTLAKREEKKKNARPYRSSGKHIQDYQNARNEKQRDKRLEEIANRLGKTHQDIKRALVKPAQKGE